MSSEFVVGVSVDREELFRQLDHNKEWVDCYRMGVIGRISLLFDYCIAYGWHFLVVN